MRHRREQPVNQRTQEKNRQDKGQSAGVRASAERHITWQDHEITRLNKESQAMLNGRPAVAGRAVLYRSAPGIGLLTAATLIAELPEPWQIACKSLAALAGVAPWTRDSGRQRGRRNIRGGVGAP